MKREPCGVVSCTHFVQCIKNMNNGNPGCVKYAKENKKESINDNSKR